MKPHALTILFTTAALLAGGCSVGGTYGAQQLIEPVATPGQAALVSPFTTTAYLLKSERINSHHRIAGRDGTQLDVWVIKARGEDAKPLPKSPKERTVLVLHGMTISKAWMLSLGEKLAAAGYDVVLPDFRAHGDSGGKYITWGAMEKHDLIAIVDTVVTEEHLAPQTYAVGVSMGGCIAIQYAAADPRCRGVVALAAPTGIRGVAKRLSPFADEAEIEDVVSRAGAMGGFDPDHASALAAAAKLTVPLILVHGLWDTLVPFEHSEQLFAAATGPRKLIPRYWQNHSTIVMGQEKWIVQRADELKTMAATLGPEQ